MFAVVKTGGKQYRVKQGDKLRVESLNADEGDTITIDHVLMAGDGADVQIGNPLLSSASVSAKVLSHGRGKKVDIVKFRRRKHYRRQMGHRQNYTEVEITAINGVSAGSSSGSSTKTAAPSKTESTEKSAPKQQTADKGASAAQSAGTGASLKFLDAPNGKADDLKKILGIGSVLEEQLNDIGIYHYSQIAELSDSDIENINTHLSFPGRIERDEWIPQAQDMVKGGEGRKLKYLDAPEGDKDDLKLILGVGPVLENKLNELGIYHFRQIAKFEAKDIDLVNDAMAFPGRIERDEWIAQAQNLADGGEPR